MNAPIILASGSAIRQQILQGAGLSFDIVRPDVDEVAIKEACLHDGRSLEDAALALATAKAEAVQPLIDPAAYVIASDQILEFEKRGFDKPVDMAEARARLKELSGQAHYLLNGTVVYQGGVKVYENLARSTLIMHTFNDTQIDQYLEEAGPDILASVGAYQVEGLGARLFKKIEGDYFAVLGLALFPLLTFLRDASAIDF
ncbi:MAG: Maf family protein [Pseudomonadota bacterium]